MLPPWPLLSRLLLLLRGQRPQADQLLHVPGYSTAPHTGSQPLMANQQPLLPPPLLPLLLVLPLLLPLLLRCMRCWW